MNNTDKLYIVVFVCLLYLFYYSKCLYLLFTYPYPWSIDQEFVTSVTGSVGFLCEKRKNEDEDLEKVNNQIVDKERCSLGLI